MTTLTEVFLSEPFICFILDGFLVIYCIVATGFFFREKFSNLPAQDEGDSASNGKEEANGGVYQELQRPGGTDVYHVIASNGKTGMRKKSQVKKSPQDNGREMDAYESLFPSTSAQRPSPQ